MTNVKPKKQTLRSCTACGTTANKQQLIRFVRSADGSVFCDSSGRTAGRGAYICNKLECFALAQKRNRLSKALKCNLNSDDYSRLQNEFTELCSETAKTSSIENTIAASV